MPTRRPLFLLRPYAYSLAATEGAAVGRVLHKCHLYHCPTKRFDSVSHSALSTLPRFISSTAIRCQSNLCRPLLHHKTGAKPPQPTGDPFLRDGTATSRLFRAYRTRLPFPLRMLGIGVLGFVLGLIIEVFACKTHLYESVMMKKDTRRHDFDEFVVDFRDKVEYWQRKDIEKAAMAMKGTELQKEAK